MKVYQLIGRQSYLKQAVIVTLILLALTFSLPILLKSTILFLALSILSSLSFGVAIMQTRLFGRLVEWLNQHQPPRPRTAKERLMAEVPSLILVLLILLGLWLATR